MKKNLIIKAARDHKFVKKFSADLSYLNKDEIEILGKLIEAAELTSRIYQAQLQDGFYPKDANRQEIEKAASRDANILSPYTMVERDSEGQLKAIPYHIKYRELLVPVAGKLAEAAQIHTTHQDFRQALLVQAKALLNGDYKKSSITWMKIRPYIIDIVIGPVERIEDRMFFTKRSYQAWVGIMHKNMTDRANALKDILISARRQILPSEKVDFMDRAQLRVDNTIVLSGMIANYDITAATLPNDIDLLEKYGSEGWIFLPSIKQEFEKCQYPLFELIFDPAFRGSFSEDLLYRGYLLMATLHEIARIIVRYRFAVDRLKEFYPILNEVATEALAVKMAGTLLVKDVISQKEMEAVLVMFLTRIFDGYVENLEYKGGYEPLVQGNAISLNSLIESGALKVTDKGISWPNFTKMFISVSELADAMEKILAEGTYKDAYSHVNKHSSLAVFKKFSTALKTLQAI